MGKRMERYAKNKKGRQQQPKRGMPKERQKKKPGLIATFFKILFSILLVFCIGAGGAVFAYYKITGGFEKIQQTDEPISTLNTRHDPGKNLAGRPYHAET